MGKAKIACVVCNYNKKEYVIGCVTSLIKQTYQNIDVIVVDNASEDGSVTELKKEFYNKISIIENTENLGGSGGFNTGLRHVLESNYKYVVLIDNDVKLAEDAIEEMYKYMEIHSDVGILGVKILQMQHPDKVQDLGGSITDDLKMKGNYQGSIDNNLPNEIECDYISTCTAMGRIGAIRKFGLMPEDNFIYWDDVEWSKKCQLAGYRTVAIGSAKVWHNHTITSGISAFVSYYMTRNRLHYFAKYCDDLLIEEMAKFFVDDFCMKIMGFYLKGYVEMTQVVQKAFYDFLSIKRGKCEDYIFPQMTSRKTPLEKVLGNAKNIKISFSSDLDTDSLEEIKLFFFILEKALGEKEFKSIMVDISNVGYSEVVFKEKLKEFAQKRKKEFVLPQITILQPERLCDLHIKMCKHVSRINDTDFSTVYVDGYGNCIFDEESKKLYTSTNQIKELFHAIYDDLTIMTIRKIKSVYGVDEINKKL